MHLVSDALECVQMPLQVTAGPQNGSMLADLISLESLFRNQVLA